MGLLKLIPVWNICCSYSCVTEDSIFSCNCVCVNLTYQHPGSL